MQTIAASLISSHFLSFCHFLAPCSQTKRGDFFSYFWPEITPLHLTLLFHLLNKVVFPQIFRFYLLFLCCHRLIEVFDLLSACYDVVLFIRRPFICMGMIQIGKMDSISSRYQIMVLAILNN